MNLLGIDVGTQSVRALLIDAGGRTRACAVRPTPVRVLGQGRAEHDPAALWHAVQAAVGEACAALSAGEELAGIATASIGEAVVLLDEAGEPLAPIVAWFDRRTEPACAALVRRLGDARLFAVTGQPPDPTLTLCKLLWAREADPAAFARARRVLNVADWIAWQFCGEAATDPSLASRTLCLDIASGTWADRLCAEAGLDPALLPPIRPAGTTLGRARAALGLPGNPVIAVGGHDHVVGGYAAGAAVPGVLLDSMGTAEALFQTVPAPPLTEATRATGFAQGLTGFGHAYIGGGINSSGGAVEWLRGLLGADRAALEAALATTTPGAGGVCFLPHLAYAAPPRQDFAARGAFAGLRADTGPGELMRAVLEGLAFEARVVADGIARLPGVAGAEALHVIGGSSRNALLMRIKASVFDRPLTVIDAPEATALGAALLAGLGAGVWRDLAEALRQAGPPRSIVAPDPAMAGTYADLYRDIWLGLFDALRPTNHAIAARLPS